MKKIISIWIVLMALGSCQQDVKFNEPAFQGLKNNALWQATTSKARLEKDGSLTIEGITTTETITLKIKTVNLRAYELGTDDSSKASLEQKNTTVKTIFSTGKDIGDGSITITEYDAVKRTVSGNFKFNAVNAITTSKLNFQKGVFYKVPVF
jgi:Family of unknown function (DUF6252)